MSYIIMSYVLYYLDLLCGTRYIKLRKKYGLEPGWLGASFGLRTCYVRIIIIRYVSDLKLSFSNVYRYLVWISFTFVHCTK